jgi:hypothetical protein
VFGAAGVLKTEDKMAKAKNRYVIVRTYSAGVFAGYLESRSGQEVVLTDARRIWYWAGAASLSELATRGTSKPRECRFPTPVGRVELLQAIEIIDVTDAAKASIAEVPVWSN